MLGAALAHARGIVCFFSLHGLDLTVAKVKE